jgi:hypothetical protein
MKPGDRVYVRMNAPPYVGTFKRLVVRFFRGTKSAPREVEKKFKLWHDPSRTSVRAEVVRVNPRTVLVRLDDGNVVKRRSADVVSIPV